MAVTFVVDVPGRGCSGLPEVTYGWAHLHAFHRMLAAEEGLDLRSMRDFGGTRPWANAGTPLRLLFDFGGLASAALEGLGGLEGEPPPRAYAEMLSRLRAIHERWSTTGPPAGDESPAMRADQVVSLTALVTVVETCVAEGGHLRAR